MLTLIISCDVLSLCYQSTVDHFIHSFGQTRTTSFWSADSTLSSLKLTKAKEVKRPNYYTVISLPSVHSHLTGCIHECVDSKFNSLIKILCISLFLMDYTELLSYNLSVHALITTECLIINYYKVMHQ